MSDINPENSAAQSSPKFRLRLFSRLALFLILIASFPLLWFSIILAFRLRANPQASLAQIFTPWDGLLLVLSISIVGVLATFLARSISKPVNKLISFMNDLMDGNWNIKLNLEDQAEFGTMADSLSRLSNQFEERSAQLERKSNQLAIQYKTISELSLLTTSALDADEILQSVVDLLPNRFNCFFAAAYRVDEDRSELIMEEVGGHLKDDFSSSKLKAPLNQTSYLGWVALRKMDWRTGEILTEDLGSRFDLVMNGTHSVAALPIILGDRVAYVLDIQSSEQNAFDADTMAIFHAVTSLITIGLRNLSSVSGNELPLTETSLIQRASRAIIEANNEEQIFSILLGTMVESPYITFLLGVESDHIKVLDLTDPKGTGFDVTLRGLKLQKPEDLSDLMVGSAVIINSFQNASKYNDLLALLRRKECTSAAIIPVLINTKVSYLILLGSRDATPISSAAVQPYTNLVRSVGTALEKFSASRLIDKQKIRNQFLEKTSNLLAEEHDLNRIWSVIRSELSNIYGDQIVYQFVTFHERLGWYEIMQTTENDEIKLSEPVNLGSDYISYLLRSQKYWMISDNVANQMNEMGIQNLEKPILSFLGVPLIAGSQVYGAIILIDPTQEGSFDQSDILLLSILAPAFASAIRNSRIESEMEETIRSNTELAQIRTSQLETAAEIARDTSGALVVEDVLRNATQLIRERFGFYHSAIFLVDSTHQMAVLRESTSEAGEKMKQDGHQLAVGSQSVVGQATSLGEVVVVNDVTNDPNYYPNPLLPDTRSEITIPLKVGTQILGALDVQSTQVNAFQPDDINVLKIVADQLAVAVDNANLYANTQNYLAKQKLLFEITSLSAGVVDINQVFKLASEALGNAYPAQAITFYTHESSGSLSLSTSIGIADGEEPPLQIKPRGTLLGKTLHEKKPLLVNDTRMESGIKTINPQSLSAIAIPIIFSDQVFGIINLESKQVEAFDQNDYEILTTLGNSLGSIVSNINLVIQIRRQVDRQQKLFEITDHIRRSVDMDSILKVSAEEICRVLQAKRATIEISPALQPIYQKSPEVLDVEGTREEKPEDLSELSGGDA